MKPRANPLLLFLLVAVCGVSIGLADEPPASAPRITVANGLRTVIFPVAEGAIHVLLPDEVLPGDRISCTIYVAPSGASEEDRAAHAAALGTYRLVCEQQAHPAGSAGANWLLPAQAPPEGFALVLENARGETVSLARIPASNGPVQTYRAFRLPSVGQAHRVITITGPFDGDSSTTRLKCEDDELRLLAESPRKLVAFNTSAQTGPKLLTLRKGDRTAEADFRSVAVVLAAPNTALTKGEATTLTVTIHGLDGLAKPLTFALENTSTDVITLSNGDSERFVIGPAEVADGRASVIRSITALKRGSWQIDCSVVVVE